MTGGLRVLRHHGESVNFIWLCLHSLPVTTSHGLSPDAYDEETKTFICKQHFRLDLYIVMALAVSATDDCILWLQVNDPDTRAVTTRIHTFLHANQFDQPPEGRQMPRFDASAHDRA